MENVRWDEIEVFVRAEVGLGKSTPLFVATRLWEDLGRTGDEADDFMGRFFERFSVDAGDFDFHRYFLMEGEGASIHCSADGCSENRTLSNGNRSRWRCCTAQRLNGNGMRGNSPSYREESSEQVRMTSGELNVSDRRKAQGDIP
ncbi:DUF1493 family protein [Burkholderia lata]|uniref:DUF1493 family protein n=1 Tax=Burkholderia lata (strain ATCC 17760 / DSM 23089 / LMG 22485 / NCIMB 9086 / R18194 / 383) TaxID=482957 RepID=UPI001E5B8F01|nr:DUF1493 family protein [Burkholderia lata]